MISVRTLLFTIAVTAVGLVPNAARHAAAQALAPYELPAILALTGPIAFGGREQQKTLGVIEDLVNRTGGIQGHPLKVIYLDDQSNPAVDVQLVNGLIARGAQVMLGPIYTASCASVAPIIEANGPVSFCFSPGYLPNKGGFVFGPGATNLDQVQAYLRFFRSRQWNRIAVLSTTDATGQAFNRALDFHLGQPDNKPLSVVAQESMGVTDISVSAQVQRIKAARPDVIFFTGSGPPYGTTLRGLSDAGITDVPVASSTANMTYGTMQQYKDVLPKSLLFAGVRGLSMVATPKGPIRDAQSRYFSSFKAAGLRPDGVNLTPWDPTWIVIDALRHLGPGATAARIHDYIENLHGWVGINGVYDFANGRQQGVQDNAVVVYHWDPALQDFLPISGPGGNLLRK